jgi:hypothetical protein
MDDVLIFVKFCRFNADPIGEQTEQRVKSLRLRRSDNPQARWWTTAKRTSSALLVMRSTCITRYL